jgi:hypothetical protein
MDTLKQYEGFIGEGYLEAADKLKECQFFLGLMKQTREFDQFRWFTNAFLSAARAVMDWLATSAYYAIPGEGQWELEEDPQAIAILKKHFSLRLTKSGKVYAESPADPILQKLVEDRNETSHRGPLWIKPEQVNDAGEFRFGWDDVPVLEFAESVIAILDQIQCEVPPDLQRRQAIPPL